MAVLCRAVKERCGAVRCGAVLCLVGRGRCCDGAVICVETMSSILQVVMGGGMFYADERADVC